MRSLPLLAVCMSSGWVFVHHATQISLVQVRCRPTFDLCPDVHTAQLEAPGDRP